MNILSSTCLLVLESVQQSVLGHLFSLFTIINHSMYLLYSVTRCFLLAVVYLSSMAFLHN